MDGNYVGIQPEYDRLQARKRARRRKKRRQRMYIILLLAVFCAVIVLVTAFEVIRFLKSRKQKQTLSEVPVPEKIVETAPDYDVQLLTVNEYSRPGTVLEQVKGIVVHYTANPGTTAQQNRDYFEGLSLSGETYASSHFVIGIEGELIQCIPCNEIAYASNDRNEDTVAIECCIADESGKFSDATLETLTHLTAWLLGRYGLSVDDVIRHYDVTGKSCPKYFVEYPLEWQKFKEGIVRYIDTYGTEKESDRKGI